MAGNNERWDAQQRSRWMRPDAARYLRPDIERYFTPAAWQAMTPAQRRQLSGAEIERKEHVVTERSVEDLQRERSWLARQKLELLELYDLHLRLRLKALNPSQRSDHYLYQPRIPKHNEGGGRWTREGGGASSYEEEREAHDKVGLVQLASSDGSIPGWGLPATLADHFERHGKSVGARDAAHYVRISQDFFKTCISDPTCRVKWDPMSGVMRLYDPKTKVFGSYDANNATKTFFDNMSERAWNRQAGFEPGKLPRPQRDRIFAHRPELLRLFRIRGGQE